MAAPPSPPAWHPPGWHEALAAADRAGRTAWPGVTLSRERFTAHASALGARPEDLAAHGADLFLAGACADGDPTALDRFEAEILPILDAHLEGMRLGPATADEVRQSLRVLLFTGPAMQIVTYSARGHLISWLRTVATRVALKVLRQADRRSERLAGEVVDRLLASSADPELHALRAQVGAAFQRALEESLAALAPRARSVLRLHYVCGLNIDAIGRLFEVHRATVARWLSATRTVILSNLRDRLRPDGRPTSSEFESLSAALRDDLHISVDRLLPPPEGG